MPVFPDDIRSLVMGNMGWPDDKVDKAVAICRFTVNEKRGDYEYPCDKRHSSGF